MLKGHKTARQWTIDELHQKIMDAKEQRRKSENQHEQELYKINLLISDCEMEIAQLNAESGQPKCAQCNRYSDLCLCSNYGPWYRGKPLGQDMDRRSRLREEQI